MSHTGKHIVLVGFMGSGKTTIGKLLANTLQLPFIDLDLMIENEARMSIPEIFEQKGEAYFRRLENDMLRKTLLDEEVAVISTGGGAPCFHNGMKEIEKYSCSFYLKVGRKRLLDRIFNNSSRPLTSGKTKKQLSMFIDSVLRAREKIYLKANHTIMAFDNPESIVRRIINQVERNNP